MLNNDTLKQFFIQGFFKSGTIRGVLERNPPTLANAKSAARGIESIGKNYERLWRKEDESIPQFIPICPRAVRGGSELTRGQNNTLVLLALLGVQVCWGSMTTKNLGV